MTAAISRAQPRSSMQKIDVKTVNHIRLITICNERIRNALSKQMNADLLRAFDEAEADEQVRAIVVTGAGDVAFSSGHDLREIAAGQISGSEDSEAAFMRPLTMEKPVIAAVNGHCYAAGFILALSCDLRIASQNAMFGSPGAKLGMLPEGGQLVRLPQLISPARAMQLMLTAVPMTADEACQCNFVTAVVPVGKVLEAGMSLANQIAGNAPAVVKAVKRGLNLGLREGKGAIAAYEMRTARELEHGAQAKEGVNAFLTKRAPIYPLNG